MADPGKAKGFAAARGPAALSQPAVPAIPLAEDAFLHFPIRGKWRAAPKENGVENRALIPSRITGIP